MKFDTHKHWYVCKLCCEFRVTIMSNTRTTVFDIDVTRDVRTNLCNATLASSLIYFALSDECRCQVI